MLVLIFHVLDFLIMALKTKRKTFSVIFHLSHSHLSVSLVLVLPLHICVCIRSNRFNSQTNLEMLELTSCLMLLLSEKQDS